MDHGSFRLYVKPSEQSQWGLLEQFSYDEASRRRKERREAKLNKARTSQMRWYYNYPAYRDASFSLEEQTSEFTRPVHVMGAKRDYSRIGKKPGGLLRRECKAIKKKTKPKRKPKPKPKPRNKVKAKTKLKKKGKRK